MANRRKIILVVGLGVLGNSVARTLAEDGAEVIAVDIDPQLVEQIKDDVDVALQLDATDPQALRQIGCDNLDAAVVCIGERFESAVLVTANLLDLGVKHVKVRANNRLTESILRRLGAHDVFFVEVAMGKVIAHRLVQPAVTHEMDLGGGYRVVRWHASPDLDGRSLMELQLPKRFEVQVIAIAPPGEDADFVRPGPETVLRRGESLLLSGHERALAKFFEGVTD